MGRELTAEDLALHLDPDDFGFETTEQLQDLEHVIGQPRAAEALRLAVGLRRPGYNLFVAGPQGAGRHAMVRIFLEERAANEPAAEDVCYVYNFQIPSAPVSLKLPAGHGRALAVDMDVFVEDLASALPAAFETDRHRMSRQVLEEEYAGRQEELFSQLRTRARAKDLEVMRAPAGLMFVPRREGQVLTPEALAKLSVEEREALTKEVETLQKESQDILRQIPTWEREHRARARDVDRETASQAVDHLLLALRQTHADVPQVIGFIDAVREDVIQNHRLFLASGENPGDETPQVADVRGLPLLRRYLVNVLVDQGGSSSAPVVYEDNPNFPNLLGRVEHRAEMGALVTDFNLIRAGALHRANGGYIVLDAHKVLSQPFAWEGLKRALRSAEIRIESIGHVQGMVSTVSLEPEPIPLDVKVVLVGNHRLCHSLQAMEPDFADLFKVVADIDEQMPHDAHALEVYPQLLATLTRRHKLLHLDRSGVTRMIEHAARITGDRERLTTRVRDLGEVMTEASHLAGEAGRSIVTATHVRDALEARRYRAGRIRTRMQEQILRGSVLIDTDGEQLGQINGLAVLQVGGDSFGRPSRITARVRMGDGKVVDIEREVELSGPSHSKGVLILSSFFAGRYAMDRPLSMSASIVFEQSYGGVDGDSASSAELYALLSVISGVPIQQNFAVTGSVNQLGRVQAIGGVNEKIEGFFELCRERGLTGEQGVLIPSSNVHNLMLRDEVVDAVENGQFHVYSVDTIDEGIARLTGQVAGEADADGIYPPDTINGKVQRRLQEMAEKREALSETGRRRGEGGES